MTWSKTNGDIMGYKVWTYIRQIVILGEKRLATCMALHKTNGDIIKEGILLRKSNDDII